MDKKRTFILIVLLLVLTVGLSTFIVYDTKVESEKDNREKQNNPVVEVDKNTNIAVFPQNDKTAKEYYTISYIKGTCESLHGDCKYIDPSTNFKNIKISSDEITIETSCKEYIEGEFNNYCDTSEIKIDNIIEYETVSGYVPGKNRIIIARTEDYYIIEDIDGGYLNGTLTIYDKKGDKIKEIENIITGFIYGMDWDINKKYENFEMILSGDFLYYASTDNYKDYLKDTDKYDEENLCKNYVHFYYMNLKTLESVEISKTCAHTAEQIP